MDLLADHLVQLADQQAITPVLTPQPGLRLQPQFYVALAETVRESHGRSVRFELLSALDGWRSSVQRLSLSRLQRGIARATDSTISVGQVPIVSRPAGQTRPLVIGIACSPAELPPWSRAVKVGTRPTARTDFQLVTA